MHDSYTDIVLPFRSDPQLLEQYTNPCGGLRVGKLAGSTAYWHILGPSVKYLGSFAKYGVYIVTSHTDTLLVHLSSIGSPSPRMGSTLSQRALYVSSYQIKCLKIVCLWIAKDGYFCPFRPCL